MTDKPIVVEMTPERVRDIALSVAREVVRDLTTVEQVQAIVRRETQDADLRWNDRFAAHKSAVQTNVNALELYFRNTTDAVTKQVNDLSRNFDTVAGRIEGALSAYSNTENTRLDEVRTIRRAVEDVRKENDETEDKVANINRQLFGDKEGGVPGLFRVIDNLDHTTRELKAEITGLKEAQKRSAERWQSVRGFAKWAAEVKLWKIILVFGIGGGSIGGVGALLLELLRTISGG
jgi:ribosomal protein L19E